MTSAGFRAATLASYSASQHCRVTHGYWRRLLQLVACVWGGLKLSTLFRAANSQRGVSPARYPVSLFAYLLVTFPGGLLLFSPVQAAQLNVEPQFFVPRWIH